MDGGTFVEELGERRGVLVEFRASCRGSYTPVCSSPPQALSHVQKGSVYIFQALSPACQLLALRAAQREQPVLSEQVAFLL